MNLPSSMIVTLIITATILTAVAFQPVVKAELNVEVKSVQGLQQTIKVKQQKKQVKKLKLEANRKNINDLIIVGSSSTIDISEVENFWLTLNKNTSLQNRVNKISPKTYTLYTDFNTNYSQAKVTIGYDIKDIEPAIDKNYKVPVGDYKIVLSPAKYSQEILFDTWEKLDYQRTIEAVLEEHIVNANGEIISVSVLYK
ncbi:hypothetical protein [Pseudoalteromonas denitrificans]|uniref:Uncharacterized protein n=1 Tax=Pseudoalteromonas denitrificans DSM 6059 TaxID=1123010 RepID=A0A1I1GUF9_9GAMM|nr:hypothetical protein [Pseudoalteromonas denitrificans]SFC12833.1 hypothetical protein SAMN02745724_00961 [Pseudoalteromonas denitrificans DSM 6059]